MALALLKQYAGDWLFVGAGARVFREFMPPTHRESALAPTVGICRKRGRETAGFAVAEAHPRLERAGTKSVLRIWKTGQ